jgi:aminomethyltransferase
MTLLQETGSPKKTPLYDRHVALQGRIVDFGGWALPVQYPTGIIAEHLWTRQSCGLFDVSHLGEIRVKGPGADRFLQYRLTNDLTRLSDGGMQYHLLCDEKGLTLDDVLVYREAADDFYVIVNASNIARDYEALCRYAPDAVKVEDKSDSTACVAVQGPESEGVLEAVFGWDLKSLSVYRFRQERALGKVVWVSRSGYTGEDGFEIFAPSEAIGEFWEALLESPKVKPAGLGARNTLRLEAGNPLYGHEINESTTPLEANLHWAVSFTKDAFVGRDMLLKQKEAGVQRRLVGFKVLDKPVARDGYKVLRDGKTVGHVTSGSYAPTVGASIGMAYVRKGSEAPGTRLEIEIHGRPVPAEVVKTPFITLKRKKG